MIDKTNISIDAIALQKILYHYVPKILVAFLILFIGIYAIRITLRIAKTILAKREIDATLSKFLVDILNWVLKILLFVTFVSQLGIETSSIVAILGAASLAVGLSLQGSLSNFAGGMLIILFKPFKVGDLIETQNIMGTVEEIQIFVTKIITANGQMVFAPNGTLSNGTITNYSTLGIRRSELIFSISYKSDLQVVKNIMTNVVKQNTLIIETPSPSVDVHTLSENSIKIVIRMWVKNSDFNKLNSEIYENCMVEFSKQNIDIDPKLSR